MKLSFSVFVASMTISVFAQAELKSVSFTEAEKSQHRAGLSIIAQTATQCLENTNAYHNQFFSENGFSPFFGDMAKSFAAMSPQNRIAYVANQTGRRSSAVASIVASIEGEFTGGEDGQFKNMSCVGIVMRCLKMGFEAANQSNLYKKIADFTRANGSDGTFLQTALRGLGWKVYYWNANVAMNATWDQQEAAAGKSNGLKGWHASRYRQVQKSGVYYYTVVDDATTLINFGMKTPEALKRMPFFVATAHSGYHVFSGAKARVVEGHAGRNVFSFDIVEAGMFNPLSEAGKPSGQDYKSGLIAVPPTF